MLITFDFLHVFDHAVIKTSQLPCIPVTTGSHVMKAVQGVCHTQKHTLAISQYCTDTEEVNVTILITVASLYNVP